MSKKARLVVLASGFGSNLQAILDACIREELPAEVVAIVSDHKAAHALERARLHQIPAEYHPWKPYGDTGKSRQDYDAGLAKIVAAYHPDFVILAGWMRVLTMSFLGCFSRRVINLHPALPGMFPGTQAIQRAFEAYQNGKITHTGVMVHFVPNEGVDDGPVILQETVSIYPDDTLEMLEARLHEVEHRLLIDAIGNALRAL